MKMINEWKNKGYVCRGNYSISLIEFDEFDSETQELIKKLVTLDEQTSNKTDEIEKYIQKYAEYYKSKGYADDDIKIVKTYYVGLKENEIVYDIKLKVMTQHSELFEHITSDKGIELTSYQFSKERNEIGQKIKNKVEIIKLKKENKELQEKIKELEKELKKYKDEDYEDDE